MRNEAKVRVLSGIIVGTWYLKINLPQIHNDDYHYCWRSSESLQGCILIQLIIILTSKRLFPDESGESYRPFPLGSRRSSELKIPR